MRANVGIDEGLRNLRQILAEYGDELPNWNEADTRFHFIDRLLTECFGWPRNTISMEQSHDGEYRDYSLGSPTEIIWEAKRSGVHFDFPADADRGTVENSKERFQD